MYVADISIKSAQISFLNDGTINFIIYSLVYLHVNSLTFIQSTKLKSNTDGYVSYLLGMTSVSDTVNQ